jgi:hypothetical protein
MSAGGLLIEDSAARYLAARHIGDLQHRRWPFCPGNPRAAFFLGAGRPGGDDGPAVD